MSPRPYSILVVEDEPITRDQLVSYFEDEGFKVTSTGSGDDVLPIVMDSDVILVLLDIKLPGKDGLTLTREIRTQSDIGIILVTSKQEQIDRICAAMAEAGVDISGQESTVVDDDMLRGDPAGRRNLPRCERRTPPSLACQARRYCIRRDRRNTTGTAGRDPL